MARAALIPVMCLLLLSGCVVLQADHPPIPPTPAEQVPLPPRSSSTLIWRPGHFDWNGSAYVWIPGEWVERAGHGTLWQDGYWERAERGSVWVPAHWI